MRYVLTILFSMLTILALLLIRGRHAKETPVVVEKLPVVQTRYESGVNPADFVAVARAAVPATVKVSARILDEWGEPGLSTGSGAILSEDGYIVTNNHVIKGGGRVTVTLSNHRDFKARVVGADAAADIAVLKIDAQGLPFFSYGNSNGLKVGQWVLAIGYPLGLESTVTAGIVSAKRESLIQTDAAVNLGNSGGPLIDKEGRLVGINAALSTSTGAYVGYSFAIPANTVKRVVNRLLGAASALATR
jgi:S1-C subfamily serine protease